MKDQEHYFKKLYKIETIEKQTYKRAKEIERLWEKANSSEKIYLEKEHKKLPFEKINRIYMKLIKKCFIWRISHE